MLPKPYILYTSSEIFVYFITKMLYCIFIMRISKYEKKRKCVRMRNSQYFFKIKSYTVVNMVDKIKDE